MSYFKSENEDLNRLRNCVIVIQSMKEAKEIADILIKENNGKSSFAIPSLTKIESLRKASQLLLIDFKIFSNLVKIPSSSIAIFRNPTSSNSLS